jgi:hypothetical protein
MKNLLNQRLSLIIVIISSFLVSMNESQEIYIRYNLAGYLPTDSKIALAFSHQKVRGTFSLIDATNDKTVFQGKLEPSKTPTWKRFEYYYQLDFSATRSPGRYYLKLDGSGRTTEAFDINTAAFENYHEDLLAFMRQQRCGYNPFIGEACHTQDGRLFYGPVPDSTYVNLSGGWHDAGDQLKYLITSSNATARMLQAFELEPDKFGDYTDAYGNLRANGIPDVLDEAKWGLDWIHKLHFRPDALVHQIADDRDHIGWKLPTSDSSDYGWGPNSYRAAYVATGKPQGLGKYKSKATGFANVAGRSAAAMALGYRVWSMAAKDPVFASKCLQAAESLYALAKSNQGYQQGNSYGAPYRYNENTWTDDMEWGAVELYKATGKAKYLEEAKGFAEMTVGTSWMEHDTASHYELYPYVNVSHFVLYPLVDPETQQKIAGYYRTGIERTLERASTNPFGIGVPFLWCSNNLVVSLITQILLYEKMTGDNQYHQHMLNHRDWLLGRNPWGTSMFTGVPKEADYPVDVHTSLWKMTGRETPGGLVDGPIYYSIYQQLLGLVLTRPDPYAQIQNEHVIYHDDIGDYSTNEPTMDGTAGAIYMMAHFSN